VVSGPFSWRRHGQLLRVSLRRIFPDLAAASPLSFLHADRPAFFFPDKVPSHERRISFPYAMKQRTSAARRTCAAVQNGVFPRFFKSISPVPSYPKSPPPPPVSVDLCSDLLALQGIRSPSASKPSEMIYGFFSEAPRIVSLPSPMIFQ